jgi:short-subunit dehydrogenase
VQLEHRYTLVTGASSGLGREIARVIARDYRGHLILVARRQSRLEELAHRLTRDHGVEAVPLVADLTDPDQVERCVAQATEGRVLEAIVLNAGVTYYGRAIDQPAESVRAMVATNVTSLVRLATQFARHFIQQETRGGLLLVSSLAGFAPMPCQAVYGATKAFVTSYGQALACELAPRGIRVTVFCPGGMATEMQELSGTSRQFDPQQLGIMDAATAARHAVRAFVAQRPLAVPGPLNWVTSVALRVLPRAWVVPVIERIYQGGLTEPGEPV